MTFSILVQLLLTAFVINQILYKNQWTFVVTEFLSLGGFRFRSSNSLSIICIRNWLMHLARNECGVTSSTYLKLKINCAVSVVHYRNIALMWCYLTSKWGFIIPLSFVLNMSIRGHSCGLYQHYYFRNNAFYRTCCLNRHCLDWWVRSECGIVFILTTQPNNADVLFSQRFKACEITSYVEHQEFRGVVYIKAFEIRHGTLIETAKWYLTTIREWILLNRYLEGKILFHSTINSYQK